MWQNVANYGDMYAIRGKTRALKQHTAKCMGFLAPLREESLHPHAVWRLRAPRERRTRMPQGPDCARRAQPAEKGRDRLLVLL